MQLHRAARRLQAGSKGVGGDRWMGGQRDLERALVSVPIHHPAPSVTAMSLQINRQTLVYLRYHGASGATDPLLL